MVACTCEGKMDSELQYETSMTIGPNVTRHNERIKPEVKETHIFKAGLHQLGLIYSKISSNKCLAKIT